MEENNEISFASSDALVYLSFVWAIYLVRTYLRTDFPTTFSPASVCTHLE